MKSRQLHAAPDGLKTFLLVFDPGDEVMAGLRAFAKNENLDAAHFTAIGALETLTVAWFDWQTKTYLPIEIAEQVEVLTLAGDVASKDGAPEVHAHVVVGKRDGTAHGGHLKSAIVRPTLELVLTQTPAHLKKTIHDESGLALIDLTR